MFKLRRRSITQQLTSAAYGLKARPRRPLVMALVVGAIAACGTALALRPMALSPEAELRHTAQRLHQENLTLKNELQQIELKMQHEVATREELQKQLSAASASQKALQDELAFIRSRTSR